MSTSWILHRIYSLDTSSLDFSRHLYCLILHDEEDQYLISLQGPQLARLVDFLNEVRTLPSAFCTVMNGFCSPSVQFPPTTTFLDSVCTNYKPSVPAARPYHPHASSYPMKSPESAVTQSPSVELPTYGKGYIAARGSLSSL